ncbi:hypothetical protein [Sulfurimonas sp.]
MDISVSSNIITVNGNLKSVGDFQSLKKTIDSMKSTQKTIIVEIIDSLSITSSIIGYLNKLVLKDGITLELKVGNENLKTLLDELHLSEVFKVQKI